MANAFACSLIFVAAFLFVRRTTADLSDFALSGQLWTATKYSNGSYRISADRSGQSALASNSRYFHGVYSARLRLPAGNSAGIITCFYMASSANPKMPDARRDEVDFEFLGNVWPGGIILHTNYYAQGIGVHEEEFQFWFDPSAAYHTYTFHWTWNRVTWLVDGVPIRTMNRNPAGGSKARGFIYQPMKMVMSVWDGSSWATDHGKIKANYNLAPFNLFIADVVGQKCPWVRPLRSCAWSKNNPWDYDLSPALVGQMNWFRQQYLIYTYTDPSHRRN
eukprot:TRINITY_DN178_c0_g1_i5.p1 TRINITY_DN178_c0_g1~~TRINITY_DN178_c0_g1_i5.p1  ORF type:complete len:277 (+),score=17.32 TRINITY_DN178_c0_g1_i5:195-1025(+)